MIGDLISAGANLIGGWLNREQAEDFNENQKYQALRNEALQREFATQGIRWKVDDARAAGVHPLYALGANTVSYSPVSVGGAPDTSLGSGVASAGQDLSRAIDSTRTAGERSVAAAASALALEKGGLENELLRVQIAKMRAQVGPPMPALNDPNGIPGQPATRVVSLPGDTKVFTNPSETQQDDISKEYGDEGLPQIPGQYRFIRDTVAALNKKLVLWNLQNRDRYGLRRHSRQYLQR